MIFIGGGVGVRFGSERCKLLVLTTDRGLETQFLACKELVRFLSFRSS